MTIKDYYILVRTDGRAFLPRQGSVTRWVCRWGKIDSEPAYGLCHDRDGQEHYTRTSRNGVEWHHGDHVLPDTLLVCATHVRAEHPSCVPPAIGV